MNRIKTLFSQPKSKLIPFITAGYPTLEITVPLVLAADASGADMIELGMPFSDPLADGPIIQKSSQIALSNGVTVKWILEQVTLIRSRGCETPIVLMGYINPIMQYGWQKFIKDCKQCGVDGLIIPDLPPEECEDITDEMKKYGLAPIMLVAPNTPDSRIKKISKISGVLLYCVSVLGVTGKKSADNSDLVNYLMRVKKNSTVPYVVGFGIKSPQDVQLINQHSDGAVVGSALIKAMETAVNPLEGASSFITTLKSLNKKN